MKTDCFAPSITQSERAALEQIATYLQPEKRHLEEFDGDSGNHIAAHLNIVEQMLERLAPEKTDDCRQQQCSYFRHYLVHYDREINGEKLKHAAFHFAEERCREAQDRVIKWFDLHQGGDQRIPEYLEDAADKWERKVCA